MAELQRLRGARVEVIGEGWGTIVDVTQDERWIFGRHHVDIWFKVQIDYDGPEVVVKSSDVNHQ